MGRKLLREWYALCPDGMCDSSFLKEEYKQDIKNNKAMYLTGLFQKSTERNGNGRIYPREILRKEIENYKRIIKERRAVGTLDHEDSEVIGLQNASHIVVDIGYRGDDEVWGTLKVLSTPMGQTLNALINDEVQLGISSRGLGSLRESNNGDLVVQEDFGLIAFDIVSEPSTHGAFLAAKTINETNYLRSVLTRTDRMHRLLDEILRRKIK